MNQLSNQNLANNIEEIFPTPTHKDSGVRRDSNWRMNHKRIGKIFLFFIVLLALLVGLQNPYGYEFSTLLLALITFVLACLPLVRWLLAGTDQKLPFFELYMLFYAVTFGFAGFMRMKSTLNEGYPISEEQWRIALMITIVSVLSHSLGYYLYRAGRSRLKPYRWPFELNRHNAAVVAPYIFFSCLSIYLIGRWIPEILKQVLLGSAYFYFLVLVVATFRRQISPPYQFMVKILLIPAVAITFSGFSDSAIAGLASTLMAVGLARFTASRKIPVTIAVIVLGAFFFFQPGKQEYRSQRWQSSTIEKPGVLDFMSLSWTRWSNSMSEPDFPWGITSESFRRLNHLHVSAALIADTPGRNPYRYGETYLPLITKVIPRAIWPDKPREDLGNRWAREYGYLDRSNLITSFNLPWLPEMYMNFGIAGVIVISFLIGRLLGFLSLRLWSHEGDSTYTAYGLLLGMPFLTPESNLSLMLGLIIIPAIVAYASLLVLNIIFPKIRLRK